MVVCLPTRWQQCGVEQPHFEKSQLRRRCQGKLQGTTGGQRRERFQRTRRSTGGRNRFARAAYRAFFPPGPIVKLPELPQRRFYYHSRQVPEPHCHQ